MCVCVFVRVKTDIIYIYIYICIYVTVYVCLVFMCMVTYMHVYILGDYDSPDDRTLRFFCLRTRISWFMLRRELRTQSGHDHHNISFNSSYPFVFQWFMVTIVLLFSRQKRFL